MRSVILCEGSDDRWFIAYYLNQTEQWDDDSDEQQIWSTYQIVPLNRTQKVLYLRKDRDGAAVWSVNGKNSFPNAIKTAVEQYILKPPPKEALDSLILVRDRDTDSVPQILRQFEQSFPEAVTLENGVGTQYRTVGRSGQPTQTVITPIILPFDREGAIETLLMEEVRRRTPGGRVIVDAAESYVDSLAVSPQVQQEKYLTKDRQKLKAWFSAAGAVMNPEHSTDLFQQFILSRSWWEESSYVKKHFSIIARAIQPPAGNSSKN